MQFHLLFIEINFNLNSSDEYQNPRQAILNNPSILFAVGVLVIMVHTNERTRSECRRYCYSLGSWAIFDFDCYCIIGFRHREMMFSLPHFRQLD
jgi:hypothetical protein